MKKQLPIPPRLLGVMMLALISGIMATASTVKDAFAICAFSEDSPQLINHIVTFPIDGEEAPEYKSAVPFYQTSTAGAFADGKYYVASSKTAGTSETADALYRMDLDTKSYEKVGTLTGYSAFVNDMTYDLSSKTMFAISKADENASALFKIDLSTGQSVKIATLDQKYFTLAADISGQLYAISFMGDFCKIDKTTGAATIVGHTGLYPENFQSMEFDHERGVLYWAATVRTLNETGTIEIQETFIATIDPATGLATRGMPIGETQLAGLYVPYVVVADSAPRQVENLSVTSAPEGRHTAILRWTNPLKTFSGSPIKAFTKIEILRDGTLVGELDNAEPGKESTYTDVVAPDGGATHTYTIVPYTLGGAGIPAEATAFIGTDVPAKVEDITITRITPNSAKVSWKAVTTGANGGWISAPTYKVVRMPEGETMAEGLTATEWLETGVEQSGSYSYIITATTDAGSSEPAQSGLITLGPKLGIPYSCEFSQEEFDKWTIVDANEDDVKWQWFNLSWAKADGAYFIADRTPADDYIVSHPIEFESGATYKLSLRHIANGNHNLGFLLLADYGLETPVQEIGEIEVSRGWEVAEKEITFTVASGGDYNLAIHDMAETGSSYLLIDRLDIEKLAENNLSALSLTGQTQPIVGNTYPYSIRIANKGATDAASYTVNLLDQDGNTIAQTSSSEAIAAGEEIVAQVSWTATEGVTSLRGKVIMPGDEIPDDNTTAPTEITVMPKGTPEELIIGTQSGTSNNHPFNQYYKYSHVQNIYHASEIGISRGRITGLRYAYKTSYSVPKGVELKVYIANTDRQTSSDGWIPQEDMSLAYEGTLDFESGEGVLKLDFQQAFDYEGGNLAIVTMSSLENAGASYYSGVSYPYYNSPVSGNSAYGVSQDNAIDYGQSGRAMNGSSIVTLMVQSGGASLMGKVYDTDGNAVEGVTVGISEIHATTLSAADGSYNFDFVPNGTYTVTASKFGFEPSSREGITINDDNATADVTIEAIPTYSVQGSISDAEGNPVAGASVLLEGYTELSATTDASGAFSFENVVSHASKITVTKDWMAPATREFELTEDIATGNIEMGYAHYSPANVTASETAEKAMAIAWTSPDRKALMRYDSGTAASQLGITDQIGTTVIGSVFRTPMQVEKLTWQTTAEGGPHTLVNIYVYGLDSEGNPTGNILYSMRNVPNTDGEWSEHIPAQPVQAPNGCFVALNYPGFLGIAIDDNSKEWPMREHTYAFSTDYNSGEFMYFDNDVLSANLLIRAEGYVYPVENTPIATVGDGRDELPGFYAYKVWRAKGFDPADSEWTEIETPASESAQPTSIVDGSWNTLSPGVYSYAVASVYPDGSMSPKAYSPYVLHNAYSTLRATVTTNSHSADPTGAIVTVTAPDGNVTASAMVDDEGMVEFQGMWKDRYTVSVSLAGYEKASLPADLTASDDLTLGPIVLKEIIAKPVNLKVYGSATEGFTLTWNESGEIFDDFESYAPFVMAPAGEIGWTYVDGDKNRTVAEPEFNFPGRTEPMSFMAFNPKQTTPSMYDARSASHPYSGDQALACFATYNGNDDYFISPRLTYHSGFKFGFQAKGYSPTYGETILVGYSLTDNDPDSFDWISGEINVPKQQWAPYEFDIPAEARYVAVNCNSADGFTLFIDDVKISSGNGFAMNTIPSGPEVSYQVSVDGQKPEITENCALSLGSVSDGMHKASVKAIYASGESEEAEITFGQSGITSPSADGIRVYPNPAVDHTVVYGDFTRATLIDLSGRVIASFGNGSARLDLSSISSGIYILAVENKDGAVIPVKLQVR